MLNVKPLVVEALENNQTLVNLLGGEKIFFMSTSEDTDLPYITYQEIDNTDDEYYDNKAYSSEIYLVFNIWSYGSTTKIAQELDKTMKSLGFKRTGAHDNYHQETEIFQKIMKYKIKRRNE